MLHRTENAYELQVVYLGLVFHGRLQVVVEGQIDSQEPQQQQECELPEGMLVVYSSHSQSTVKSFLLRAP